VGKDLELSIDMDFRADFAQYARARLMSAAYQIGPYETAESIIMKYFNVHKRRITVCPRTILISKEFHCPLEVQAGLNEVLRKAEVGEDLRPHQSKELFLNPEYNDQLLNHWNIQHLHLDILPHRKYKGLLKRSKLLLFARVTPETMYCINILDHDAWTQQQMLGVIHRNWPDSIAQFRLDEMQGEKLSDQEVRSLRDKNCNVSIAMADGVAYLPIGNGSSSSGISTDVVLACARVRSYFRQLEDVVRTQLPTHLNDPGQAFTRYRLQMQIQNGEIFAIDAQAGLTIKLGAANFVPY
jgi:hypothetical protein